MEHSYSRDWRPMEGAQVMTTKTIMVHRPPQCPSCHTHDDVMQDFIFVKLKHEMRTEIFF